MAVTLNSYILTVRRLLHDAQGQFWTDADLTAYINEARNKTVMDTGCLRVLQPFTMTAGLEVYPFTALPTQPVVDILNVTVLWGATRVPLAYWAFTDLTQRLRVWVNFQQLPAVFSVYGQSAFYVAPVPDQAYVCEIDTVILPTDLTTNADVEQISYPFSEPVQYWAARQAKLNQQAFEEADKFEALYVARVNSILQGVFTRRIRSTIYDGAT